jgi:hypothetical protein
MKSNSLNLAALGAAVIAIVVAMAGCSSVSGPGKRIKDGFADSEKAKTVSFEGEFKIKMPKLIPFGNMTLAFTGDGDTKGTATATDDDMRMQMTVSVDGSKEKSTLVSMGGTQWETTGGKSIGGPDDLEGVDSDWDRVMKAVTDSVENLEESGSAEVAGTKVTNFSAEIPKVDVCTRLVPVFADIFDAETGGSASKSVQTCKDGLLGPVTLRIALDQKDWPRLLAARGKVDLVALFKLIGAGDVGLPSEMSDIYAEVSVSARVTQYDQPIDPITAPANAKMYKTLAEFDRASERLSK